MMQIGMIVGFFTAWPVNSRLIRKGWKETTRRPATREPVAALCPTTWGRDGTFDVRRTGLQGAWLMRSAAATCLEPRGSGGLQDRVELLELAAHAAADLVAEVEHARGR